MMFLKIIFDVRVERERGRGLTKSSVEPLRAVETVKGRGVAKNGRKPVEIHWSMTPLWKRDLDG